MKILDFSHRLPGPLAGRILADLGHDVIKVEDQKQKDPFLDGFFKAFDPSFELWYEELNQNKKLLRLDFSSPNIKDEIKHLIQSADALILSLSEGTKAKLGLAWDELKKYPLAVVELGGSQRLNKPMHDLNALAESGVLPLFLQDFSSNVVSPPFLPFAGISMGQHVATHVLDTVLKMKVSGSAQQSKVYLLETIERIYEPFWPKILREQKSFKFLHNGAYPCYSLYRLQDNAYLAVAAVEEKFWQAFSQAFNITLENRFDRQEKAFASVSNKLSKLTKNDVKKIIGNNEWCVSLIEL
jgi:alpha-methylacyl-CoA racemase